MHTASRLGRLIAFKPNTWHQASALAAPFSAYIWQACSWNSIQGNSMPLPVVPSTFQALSTRSVGRFSQLVPRSSKQVGPPGHRNRLQPRLRPQPQCKQSQPLPTDQQQQLQEQQQCDEQLSAQQLLPQQQQQQQRKRRPTFSSPAAALRHWQRQQQQQAMTLSPQQLQQQQQQKQRGIAGVSSSSSTPVIAASAASSTEAYPAAGAALRSSLPRLPGPASRSRRSTSRFTISLSPAAPVQTQQQQQQQDMPPWHVFGSSSSHSGHHHHQQQQQQQMQELRQLPPTAGPVMVDITHLVNLQQQQSPDEDSWTSSSSSSSSSQRRKKLTPEQKQLQMLDNINPLQQLFWVTINQPKGGSSPAAVWIEPWPAALRVEALQFSEGPSGQDLVLFEVQERPDMGQRPAVVVEGLRFPSVLAVSSSSSSATAAEDSTTHSSSSGEGSEITTNTTTTTTTTTTSSSSSSDGGGVYDYLVLCSGEFSPLEHENMFPNAFVHCGDGRQLHQARGAHDVAAFVAEPDFQLVEAHCHNLMRYAYDLLLQDKLRCSGPMWVYEKLVARWGADALWQFGVDVRYVNDNLFKVLPQPKLPTVA